MSVTTTKPTFDDFDLFEEKLKNYYCVDPKGLTVGSHFRYCKNKFKSTGRQCVYGIVKEIGVNDVLTVEGYKSEYTPWKVDPKNKWAEFRFYVKKDV